MLGNHINVNIFTKTNSSWQGWRFHPNLPGPMSYCSDPICLCVRLSCKSGLSPQPISTADCWGRATWSQRHVTPRLHGHTIQSLWKYIYLAFEEGKLSNLFTISYCHSASGDMCKSVAWLDHSNKNKFHHILFQIWTHKLYVKWLSTPNTQQPSG